MASGLGKYIYIAAGNAVEWNLGLQTKKTGLAQKSKPACM
jgi:hypothetical protein